MEDEEDRPRGISRLAYQIDQFLKNHLGWPYRLVLAAGLVVGIVSSLNTLEKAFGSTQNVTEAIIAIAFQAALLINQLAQVNEWRHEQRMLRKRRIALTDGRPPRPRR